MAGPIVHKEFFKECLGLAGITNLDDENNLNIFAQGHDLFLYCPLWHFEKNRNLSLIISNYKFKEFVIAYLQTSVESKLIYNNKSVKAFLYGYISHHILDSYFHPFIMQYTPDYLPVKGRPWMHGEIEALYDALFIVNKHGMAARKYKIHKDFAYNMPISDGLISIIDKELSNVYGIKNCGEKLREIFRSIDNHMRLYRYDPIGFKTMFASFTEPIVQIGAFHFFYGSTDLNKINLYKNVERKEWKNIYNGELSTNSFNDIYEKAMTETVYIINGIEYELEKQYISIEMISRLIPDRSAITGARCGIELPFIKHKGEEKYK